MFETGIFWGAVALCAVLGRALSTPGARAGLFAVASALVLWLGLGLPPAILAGLIVVSFWLPLGLRLAHAQKPFQRAFLVFAPVFLAWIVGKQAVAAGFEPLSVLGFAGFSFALVKVWTYLKDTVDGRAPAQSATTPATPAMLAGYLLHFPTYTSGPMHTYAEYAAGLEKPAPLDAEAVVDLTFRALLGFVKLKLLAPLFVPFSLAAVAALPADAPGASPGLSALITGAFAYSLVIFLDFSGYSDVAIALSRAVGFTAPENFQSPYLARNIRDFWQRWHMSFSRALTSYVFVPLTRALQARPALKGKARAVMVLAYLGTFTFCGYWHGPTLGFVIWGVYHAVGLIVFDVVRANVMRRRLKNKQPPPKGARALVGRVAATACTFAFVSLGWIPFAIPLGRLFSAGGGAP